MASDSDDNDSDDAAPPQIDIQAHLRPLQKQLKKQAAKITKLEAACKALEKQQSPPARCLAEDSVVQGVAQRGVVFECEVEKRLRKRIVIMSRKPACHVGEAASAAKRPTPSWCERACAV